MSLKKIAEMTGTSISTVSRVLNRPDYHCHNAEMEERIREAARKVNYLPNTNARSLKLQESTAGKIYSVDILLARFHTLDQDPFFRELFQFLETELLQQNCKLRHFLTVPDFSLPESESIHSHSAGIIVLGKCPASLVDTLHRRYQAVVAVDRNPTEYKMDEIVCDGAKAAKIVVEYLYELGHRSIGYIGDCNTEARFVGYYESLLSHKLALNYDNIVSTGQTREEGFHAYEKLMNFSNPPSAVFCANDVTALGFLQAMNEKTDGRKKNNYWPAVVSIDDIRQSAHTSPMLTTVHIPKEDMVHLAVLMLKDRLMGKHREFLRIELPCHLMIRESSGVHILS